MWQSAGCHFLNGESMNWYQRMMISYIRLLRKDILKITKNGADKINVSYSDGNKQTLSYNRRLDMYDVNTGDVILTKTQCRLLQEKELLTKRGKR